MSREILDYRATVELGLKRFFSNVLWGEQRFWTTKLQKSWVSKVLFYFSLEQAERF